MNIPLNRPQHIIWRMGIVAALLILLFPPCKEYADYDPVMPRWLFIAQLYRPGNLYYPQWGVILTEAACLAVATAVMLCAYRSVARRSQETMSW
jgi:hypothetical protein